MGGEAFPAWVHEAYGSRPANAYDAQLLDCAEAARYLGVSARTVGGYISRGLLRPAFLLGADLYFERGDLDDFKRGADPERLGYPEAARYLGVSVRSLRRLVEKGILMATQVLPRRRVFERNALDAYIKSCRTYGPERGNRRAGRGGR